MSVVIVAATFALGRTITPSIPPLVITAATLVVLWILVWIIGSGRFVLPSSRITVVFAFDVDVEAERNFRRIFTTLRREVRSLTLRKPISVTRIASDLITSHHDAHRYVSNFDVDQVVWGRALAGKAKGEQIYKFELFWTQRFPPHTDIDTAAEDVRTLLMGRKWRIADLDELNDVAIVAEDFVEVSLGIIGITFFLEDRLDDAVEIFERVVRGLAARASEHGDADRKVQLQRFQTIFDGTRVNLAIDAHNRGDHQRAVALVRSVLPTSSHNVDALMTIARASYYEGNLDDAIAYTERIRAVRDKHPAVPVNVAFFNILKGDYDAAGRSYDQLLKMGEDAASVIPSVSQFLEERYDADPHEHAFLYGMAVVNGFFETDVMMQDLRLFLERTSNMNAYEPLRRRASEIIREHAGPSAG